MSKLKTACKLVILFFQVLPCTRLANSVWPLKVESVLLHLCVGSTNKDFAVAALLKIPVKMRQPTRKPTAFPCWL